VWAAEGRSCPQLVDELLSLARRAARTESRYAP
jgi:hypothetical protein